MRIGKIISQIVRSGRNFDLNSDRLFKYKKADIIEEWSYKGSMGHVKNMELYLFKNSKILTLLKFILL